MLPLLRGQWVAGCVRGAIGGLRPRLGGDTQGGRGGIAGSGSAGRGRAAGILLWQSWTRRWMWDLRCSRP